MMFRSGAAGLRAENWAAERRRTSLEAWTGGEEFLITAHVLRDGMVRERGHDVPIWRGGPARGELGSRASPHVLGSVDRRRGVPDHRARAARRHGARARP